MTFIKISSSRESPPPLEEEPETCRADLTDSRHTRPRTAARGLGGDVLHGDRDVVRDGDGLPDVSRAPLSPRRADARLAPRSLGSSSNNASPARSPDGRHVEQGAAAADGANFWAASSSAAVRRRDALRPQLSKTFLKKDAAGKFLYEDWTEDEDGSLERRGRTSARRSPNSTPPSIISASRPIAD